MNPPDNHRQVIQASVLKPDSAKTRSIEPTLLHEWGTGLGVPGLG